MIKRQSIAETVADILKRRPILKVLLEKNAELFEAKKRIAEELQPILKQDGIQLPAWDKDKASQGIPLVAGIRAEDMENGLYLAAQNLWPVLSGFVAGENARQTIAEFFRDKKNIAGAVDALLSGDEDGIRVESSVLPAVIFCLEQVLGVTLRAAALSAPADWDAHPAAWRQGYCPVCGSFPSVSFLEKKETDPKNAFLASGGGKKHFHCAVCGTEWHFRRAACPFCGKEGPGVMEFMQETGINYGERLDWCTACKHYCPSVDLREHPDFPDMDAQSVGMMHLGIVAAEKGLQPLKACFWNQV